MYPLLMPGKKLPILLVALLLKAGNSVAQNRPAPPPPDPNYQEVSIPVPRAVSLFADVAGTLLSRTPEGQSKVEALLERRRARSEKREQSIDITIPKNKLTRTLGLVE